MMSKKVLVPIVLVAFVLAGVGGWFLHSSMVEKDYEAAWKSYGKEVQAWQDVNERYQVLEPVCGELAGEAECGELKTVGEQAGKATEKLSLDLKKAKSASKEETQKLEKATKAITAEREKCEPAVVKVEKAAEVTIQDKFAPVLGEAEKKAGEASELVGSLAGKVKDDKVLEEVKKAAGELSSACGKWKGKDIPAGQEGVQAYLELKRLTLACNDAATKANESHAQWQVEKDAREASIKEDFIAWIKDDPSMMNECGHDIPPAERERNARQYVEATWPYLPDSAKESLHENWSFDRYAESLTGEASGFKPIGQQTLEQWLAIKDKPMGYC